MNLSNLILFINSFLISFAFFKLSKPVFKKYLLSKPNIRSTHQSPTPQGAGIIFAICSSVYGYLDGSFLFLFCLPIAIIGMIDDLYNLSRKLRYLSHLVISGLIVSHYLDLFISREYFLIYICVFLLLTFISTVFINLTNFMDGLDGLVSGCMLISFTLIMLSSDINLLPLLGPLLSFTIFNWPPAKIFMGDAGSTFLGLKYFVSILSLGKYSLLLAFTLINIPMYGDALVCLIRRLLTGQNIFRAHRLHSYQRLYLAGWNKTRISLFYILNTLFLSLIFYIWGINLLIIFSVVVIILGFYVDIKYSSPFNSFGENS